MMIRLMNKLLCFLYRHKQLVMIGIFLVVMIYTDYAFAEDNCSEKSDEEKYLCYCDSEVIRKKYVEAGCWACDVIFTLMMSMTDVAGSIYETTKDLSMTILGFGAVIWIALYFLKALGSFTTQDPAKVIDGLLTFCFKVALVYGLIDLGIEAIVQNIVNPLLSIGIDIGNVFSGATGL